MSVFKDIAKGHTMQSHHNQYTLLCINDLFHLQKVCHQFTWILGKDRVLFDSLEYHAKSFLNFRWGNVINPALSTVICVAVKIDQGFF